MRVITGLERLSNELKLQQAVKGNIAYLCHAASIDSKYRLGVFHLQKIFGNRLKMLIGPQHGIMCDLQDNMQESEHTTHPFFKLPVISLYSETRAPTDQMLQGIDTIIVDLQDVGCRVYTYINTMTLVMEAAGRLNIDVVVLDRPNPVGGAVIEGNILKEQFCSFVGRHPIPMRHGLTIGEMAHLAQTHFGSKCNLNVIPMEGWQRKMIFCQTGLPWVLPSPNLPTTSGALIFSGTVLFEGTNISEGRGTTRSLEIIGHPKIEPYQLLANLEKMFAAADLRGFTLRPLNFLPTFQKHQGVPCGGFQIHPTDPQVFRPWRVGQMLLKALYHHLGSEFAWNQHPYEYEYDQLAIDLINGDSCLRQWVEQDQDFDQLVALEQRGRGEYLSQQQEAIIYR